MAIATRELEIAVAMRSNLASADSPSLLPSARAPSPAPEPASALALSTRPLPLHLPVPVNLPTLTPTLAAEALVARVPVAGLVLVDVVGAREQLDQHDAGHEAADVRSKRHAALGPAETADDLQNHPVAEHHPRRQRNRRDE